jgi:hypothetical protein
MLAPRICNKSALRLMICKKHLNLEKQTKGVHTERTIATKITFGIVISKLCVMLEKKTLT